MTELLKESSMVYLGVLRTIARTNIGGVRSWIVIQTYQHPGSKSFALQIQVLNMYGTCDCCNAKDFDLVVDLRRELEQWTTDSVAAAVQRMTEVIKQRRAENASSVI